ncbi:protein of unknown function DUF1683, C-terminal [Kalmanozyma brasiliensis GHG001]|uniref:protein of unknown function DUF1683, C-terminal n=1 Tax=Kalmanozyma brasiliensis (strain GHG001) TaxID=1365824 RepID=UPI00286829EC|nr:protein of unknown function DUF1683, C-terminal [Kalmanozyma brasiliensis GHG001]KAF6766968.1 protein of unknown function DUF1683, C-terminal [Kalmanozyma brasiliensis GHG001]
MNAFPSELLHHHFACMVVAGLTAPSKPASNTASASSSSAPAVSTLTDATPGAAAAPADHPTTVFPDLTASLHDILASRARNTLWDPSRGRSAVFHTVFADHLYRLPPLKTKPSARHVPPIPSITAGSSATPSESSTAAFSALPPRSPLSPLHPNSPQFPDGLIAPVWVRKHRDLVPSVLVSFHVLPASPDTEELRKLDESLVKLISERRRTLTERGIKLTIVLLTQRQTLDDAQLEARLSFVRRNSGLDSKASLFVLTPVTKVELGEFVTSLHSALFEPAADFYREHARRVKRKRTRYPPPPSTLQPIVAALGTLPPATPSGRTVGMNDISWLSREGWIVRSEYKLAVFAELAGDMTEAALRYKDAYELLCNSPTCLLGSTMMLPPRTKRWAEAKVLADTLCVRICKLLLYADDGTGAALFFRKHLARFTDLSTGWGIGAMTFEYWSWLAKQYRMFGELVEHATRTIPGSPLPPFQLPIHAPPLPSRLLHPDALPRFSDGRGEVSAPPNMLLPNANAVAVSTIPGSALQSPGGYYYLAALCTVERRTRFLRALSSQPSSTETEESGPLAHESKVDHTAQLTEALTKAYDAFKRGRMHRHALFIAAKIATAYDEGGQDEMALKFLERILKSYAKEGWGEVRRALVEVAIEAAVRAGDRASVVRLLVETLDSELEMDEERRREVVEAAKRFLIQTRDGVDGKEVGEEEDAKGSTPVTAGFLDVQVVFPVAEVEFGAEVPFQLVVRNTSSSDLMDVLSADGVTLHIQSGDDEYQTAVEVNAALSKDNTSKALIVDLGLIDLTSTVSPTSADLSRLFLPHSTTAFQGTIKALHPGLIRISSATISLASGQFLDLPLPDPEATALQPCTWLLPTTRTLHLSHRSDPTTVLVRPQRHNLSLLLTAPPLVYIDERVPLRVALHNHESVPLAVDVDALLQPRYEGALDTLCATEEGDQQGQSVKALPVEIAAGGDGEVVLWLTGRQAAGVRTVDVSVRVGEEVVVSASVGVDVRGLFACTAWCEGVAKKELALLEFDEPEADGEGVVGLDVEVVGESTVHVSKVELVSDAHRVAIDDDALGEWHPRDRFSFSLPLPFSPSPRFRITWSHPDQPQQTSLIPLPPPLPTHTEHLTITLTYPPTSTLGKPLDLGVTLHNPHPTRSVPVVVTVDSDDHFTLAAARRVSIPFLLPGQTRVLDGLARLVPQSVGVFPLPNITVILGDGEDRLSVASRDWDEAPEREVQFRYRESADGKQRTGLPRLRVGL